MLHRQVFYLTKKNKFIGSFFEDEGCSKTTLAKFLTERSKNLGGFNNQLARTSELQLHGVSLTGINGSKVLINRKHDCERNGGFRSGNNDHE